MQPLPLFEAPETAPGLLSLGLAGDGELRWAAADIGGPIEAMRARLDLAPIPAVTAGRAAAAATLLLRFSTKYAGRLRFDVKGDGPLGAVSAEVDSAGWLRATVDQPQYPGIDGQLDVGQAVGEGMLLVTQTMTNRPEPWTSQTRLVDGEIGNDLVHFLHQSYQVRSAAMLGVHLTPDGVGAAGGLLVEALPGTSDELVEALITHIATLGSVGGYLLEGGIELLVNAVLSPFAPEELERHEMRYGCDCSRDSVRDKLRTLPHEQLANLIDEDGACDVECAFCSGIMRFSSDQLLVQ